MIAMVEFISASTAGIVNVELGFVPNFAIFIQNHGGTNPNMWFWSNMGSWATAQSIKLLGDTSGGSDALTLDTSGITAFAGGNEIADAETANSSPKHVDRDGTFAAAGHVAAPGLAIPADHQTNSGRNLLIALRNDS